MISDGVLLLDMFNRCKIEVLDLRTVLGHEQSGSRGLSPSLDLPFLDMEDDEH